MTSAAVKKLLEEKVLQYNCSRFIDDDPIQIPHSFRKKEDIEIAAFFSSALAWGQRKSIISKSRELMNRMDDSPFDFITSATNSEIKKFSSFVYRTFNGDDCMFFLHSIRHIYKVRGGLQGVFEKEFLRTQDLKAAIMHFRKVFFETDHQPHVEKHISDPSKYSACKRINLFLRWMVRKDNFDVDFGLWKKIPPYALYIPLDVHTARAARAAGLLKRKQDDWKAVEELTDVLRSFDPADPVKYDYALFCLSRYEGKSI